MFSKITFSRLFIFVTMILFVTTLLLYLFFTQTKENIVTSFERTGVEEVEEISRNISQYILHVNSANTLHQALVEDHKLKEALEHFLATFQTQKIKNIFIVDKPNENSILFRVLLDGSKEKSDKFQFEELFEPENTSWAEVIRLREDKVLYHEDRVDIL